MFERFTASARATVLGAQCRARAVGAAEITPQHMMLAMAEQVDTPVTRLLAEYEISADALAGEFERVRKRAGLSDADADALENLGIDVDRVLDSVQRSLGDAAIARGPRPGGRHRFTGETKRVMEQSLKEARALQDSYLGVEHLLLALLARPGVVRDVLADQRLTHDMASRRLLAMRELTA